MSKIADAEANATSLDGLVNDNGLITTLRNGPKPSYQYLVDGWNSEFNLAIEQYKESRGFNTKGTFADGFTYELPNDVGLDTDGNPWILIDTSSLPVIVSAGTTPTNPPYKQVAYGTASQVSTNTSDTVQSFVDSFSLKIFQSPTDGGLTEIQTRTVNGGEVYEVRKTSDDSLATIYSDASGTIEIVQNGTDNKSGRDGVVEFYIADGDYTVTINAVSTTVNVGAKVRKSTTVSEVASGLFGIGSKLALSDRGDAKFDVVSGGTANGYTILDAGGGNTATLVHSGKVQAEWVGFKDSNLDNAPALQAAIEFARPLRLEVIIPPSPNPFMCSKVTVYGETALRGAGARLTKLKLPDNTNTDVIYSHLADTYWGTGADGLLGANGLELSDFSIDGNRNRANNNSGNTTGNGISYYGRTNRFKNIVIEHAATYGMRTEWGSGGGDLVEGLEGLFSGITIGYSGEENWRFAGAHDSHCEDIILHTPSQKSGSAYKNLWIEKGNARWTRVHTYSLFYTEEGFPTEAARHSHGLYINGDGPADGNEFSLCHFEGGDINIYNGANSTLIDSTCRVYYPWNGVNIINDGSSCVIEPWLGEEFKGIGLPLAKGIIFGGTYGGSSNCYINLKGTGMEAGWVDFGSIAGGNSITVRGFNAAAGNSGYVGSVPSDTNDIDLVVTGPELSVLKRSISQIRSSVSTVQGSGSTQGDATSLDKLSSSVVIDGGASGSGVRLASTVDMGEGAKVFIANVTGVAIKLYPSVFGNLLGYGVNNPITISPLKSVTVLSIDEGSGTYAVMNGA